ncbi:hypothetical protein LCGC14_1754710 [marine sediment metagenome]|uniref:Uncharacterized protein n=1 Tax=marine sediment metagenome TaxID=412755 RepID=A0A0F9H2W9_9ZZZZ
MNESIKYLYRCVLISNRRIKNYKDSIIELVPTHEGVIRTMAVDLKNNKIYIKRGDNFVDPTGFPEYWR